jgi:hypothetical protein
MALIYSPSAVAARLNAVIGAIGSGGKLKLLSADDTVLVTFSLASPAATVSGSVMTFSDANGDMNPPQQTTAGIMSATAHEAGTAVKATVTDSADIPVITGLTVGTGAGNIRLTTNSFTVAQPVQINSATITHP